MSLKDRIQRWSIDSAFGPYDAHPPDPLVVSSEEFKQAIEIANGPLVHKKGKTILKIDGFEVHFKVLDFNDYLKQVNL